MSDPVSIPVHGGPDNRYDVLVGNYLAERGIEASVVHLDGAVESSVQLGIADFANSAAYARRARDLGITVVTADATRVGVCRERSSTAPSTPPLRGFWASDA